MLFRIPYRWTLRTAHSNIWWAVTDIWDGVCNVCRWAPVIWDDADFDWEHLAKVMEYKLRRQAHLEEAVGHHVGSRLDAKRMRVCADLLRRLQADEYWTNAVSRFGETPAAAKFSHNQQKSDQRYLGLILGKYLTHWWD
jgi:hypothetical protein